MKRAVRSAAATVALAACGQSYGEIAMGPPPSDGGAEDVATVVDASPPEGPPSCAGLLPRCGPSESLGCCDAPELPGGAYLRLNKPEYPATVSPFRLDRFEVVVGRFRRYVEAQPAATRDILRANLACPGATWTDAPGDNEYLPINCVLRADAVAFCAWDQGTLETEAQWNFAAAGGDEQRYFPWSSPPSSGAFDSSHVASSAPALERVGSHPKGAGRWGHLDLAGNAYEIMLDLDGPLPVPCADCVNDAGPVGRIMHRGGSSLNPAGDGGIAFSNVWREGDPDGRTASHGFRCAR